MSPDTVTPGAFTPDTFTMEQAAACCGLSWERFRKVWPALPGFPPPFKRPYRNGRGAYAWRAEAVRDWRLGRERAFGEAAMIPPDAANDVHAPRAAHTSAVTRQRAELARLMAGGRR